MNTVIVDGQKLAKSVLTRSVSKLNFLQNKHKIANTPKLAIVVTGSQADSLSYRNSTRTFFQTLGLEMEVIDLGPEPCLDKLKRKVLELNEDSTFHGIQLHLPLPLELRDKAKEVFDLISPSKDVEGLTSQNYEKMLNCSLDDFKKDSADVLPCCFLSALEVIERHGIECQGKKAVVLGNSYATGHPIASMLQKKEAAVTECDINTTNIKDAISDADIIVSATGCPDPFDLSVVKSGSTVIDFGINFVDGKFRGDLHTQDLLGKAGLVTPVPRGMGPITSAMVVRNLVQLWNVNETSLSKAE